MGKEECDGSVKRKVAAEKEVSEREGGGEGSEDQVAGGKDKRYDYEVQSEGEGSENSKIVVEGDGGEMIKVKCTSG